MCSIICKYDEINKAIFNLLDNAGIQIPDNVNLITDDGHEVKRDDTTRIKEGNDFIDVISREIEIALTLIIIERLDNRYRVRLNKGTIPIKLFETNTCHYFGGEYLFIKEGYEAFIMLVNKKQNLNILINKL